jgi:hypothetical protein
MSISLMQKIRQNFNRSAFKQMKTDIAGGQPLLQLNQSLHHEPVLALIYCLQGRVKAEDHAQGLFPDKRLLLGP